MTVALHILFHSGAEEGLTGVTERKQYARPSIYYLIPTVSLQTGLFSANKKKHTLPLMYIFMMLEASMVFHSATEM